MSTSPKLKQIPAYAVLSDAAAERYARKTAEGIFNLLPFEVFWQQVVELIKVDSHVPRLIIA